MLSVSSIFTNDTLGNNLNVVPLINITKGIDYELNISTQNLTFDGKYYKPILLNIPSIKESVDFESRKFKISNVTLSISNVKYNGQRVSDEAVNFTNADVVIYWKSQSCTTLNECLKVYRGKVKRVNHDDKNFNLQLEDVSQENLYQEVPIARLGDEETVPDKHKNKPIPMVYGYVDKCPTVLKVETLIYNKDFVIISDSKPMYEYVSTNWNKNIYNTQTDPLWIYKNDNYFNVKIAPLNISPTSNYTENQYNLHPESGYIHLEPIGGVSGLNAVADNMLETDILRIPEIVHLSHAYENIDDYLGELGGEINLMTHTLDYAYFTGTFIEIALAKLVIKPIYGHIPDDDIIYSRHYNIFNVYLNHISSFSEDSLRFRAYYDDDLELYEAYFAIPQSEGIYGINEGESCESNNMHLYTAENGTINENYDIDQYEMTAQTDELNWTEFSLTPSKFLYYVIKRFSTSSVELEAQIRGIGLYQRVLFAGIDKTNFFIDVKGRKDKAAGTYTGIPAPEQRGSSRDGHETVLNYCDTLETFLLGSWSETTLSLDTGYDSLVCIKGETIDNRITFIAQLSEPVYNVEGWNIKIWFKHFGNYGSSGIFSFRLGDSGMNISNSDIYNFKLWKNVNLNSYTENEWHQITLNSSTIWTVEHDWNVIEKIGLQKSYTGDFSENVTISMDDISIGVSGDILGCMDEDAYNYNPEATIDDGTCIFYPIPDYFIHHGLIPSDVWDGVTPFQGGDRLSINAINSYDPDGGDLVGNWEFISGVELENVSMGSTEGFSDSRKTMDVPDYIDDFFAESVYKLTIQDDEGLESWVNITVPLANPDYVPPPTFEDETAFDATQLIENPADIITHIICEELGFDNSNINPLDHKHARQAHFTKDINNWKFGFTVNKKIDSKKLIEDIAKSTRLFPKFRNDGTFGFNSMRYTYDMKADYVETLNTSDIISFKISRTKIDDVKSRVKIFYNKDYALDDFTKSFPIGEGVYRYFSDYGQIWNNDSSADMLTYYGIDSDENATLDFESEYIRDETTAEELCKFLVGWYMNQHLILDVKLPLSYLKYEIGDIVAWNELLGGVKAFGEDYTITSALEAGENGEHTLRNGQVIYPLFMIMESNKSVNSVSIKMVQLHDSSMTLSRDYSDTTQQTVAMRITNPETGDHYGVPSEWAQGNDVIGINRRTPFQFSAIDVGEVSTVDWIFTEIDSSNIPIEGGWSHTEETVGIEDLVYTFGYNIVDGEVGNEPGFEENSGFPPRYYNVTMVVHKPDGTTAIDNTGRIRLYQNGDVNLDGGIDVLDIVLLVGHILTSTVPSEEIPKYLIDLSNDDQINVIDIVLMVNIILESS